ncbi:MAG: M15 family metallopeptidase [Clostridia bacterium]|nr:M15 family metallopeptidase [Clostridia bacterium]
MSSICKSISELTPKAQLACKTFLAECRKLGLKVRITETYRSQQRQDELYAKGRTASGNIVTWTRNSRHTSRRAWDICQDIKGREYDTSDGFFEKCGAVAKELGIIWGGSWKIPDRPHFEIDTLWSLPEEYDCEDIAVEELNIIKRRLEELEKANAVYNYIDSNMPEWIRHITEWALEKGIITGTGTGLGMTKTKAETLVMIKNAAEKLK